MRHSVIAATLAVALCGTVPRPAAAADRPPFPPSRDVAVSYRVTSDGLAGGPRVVDVAFSAALQKLHAETDPGAVIVDIRRKSAIMMMTQQHIAMRLPAGREIDRVLALNGQGGAVRTGADRVAGYPCAVWRITGKDGNGTVCVTSDGVPLRGEGRDAKGHVGSFEALKADYGALPAALFDVPPGFHEMDVSALMGARARP